MALESEILNDPSFRTIENIISLLENKGTNVTVNDISSIITNIPNTDNSSNKSPFLSKLDYPNGPIASLSPAPNEPPKLVSSTETERQLSSVDLIGKQLTFQQPIKGSWKNLGAYTTTPFLRPVDGPGAKPRDHRGLDMGAPGGTPIYPIAPGVVTQVTYESDPDNTNKLGGTSVSISHYGGKISSYYAHMDNVTVNSGQTVTMETQIGTCGQSGNARNGPAHLHLGVRINGQWVDPGSFIGNTPTSQLIVRAGPLYRILKIANIVGKILEGRSVSNVDAR